MTNAYEELVERCGKVLHDRVAEIAGSQWHDPDVRENYLDHTRAILAEVLRTLENVTPEMEAAWDDDTPMDRIYLAMLRASPLVKGEG